MVQNLKKLCMAALYNVLCVVGAARSKPELMAPGGSGLVCLGIQEEVEEVV